MFCFRSLKRTISVNPYEHYVLIGVLLGTSGKLMRLVTKALLFRRFHNNFDNDKLI